ncbi:CHAD domain-containing protein [Candidatus Palauibacter soopunensis]|uniref:CYTH and CHAD domain-containing protein n=1 Tax=Candidatus Palauibacter soopunensis TaxID=3056739 RepID=UPI00287335E9|nr:CHAD domain-containing protein [Candidatus Palauibacter soopunensis]
MVPATVEVEVKLTGDPAELAAVFGDLGGTRPAREQLVTVYYDTPEGHLRRRGFALRIRRGRGVRELTLKRDEGDGLTRGEWTSLLPPAAPEDATPRLDQLPPEAPVGELAIPDADALNPTFLTDIERTKKEVRTGDALIEASLDMGRISAGEREAAVAELELELLSGPVGDMLAGARALLEKRRLRLGTRSKAASGTDLLLGTSPPAVRATRVKLEPADSIGGALAKVVRAASIHVTGNLAPVLEAGDPEGIHQLRVSLRRLRSALLFLKPDLGSRAAALNREARRALKRLGPARDFDVFVLETLPPVIEANPRVSALLRLREAAEGRREAALASARKLILGRRFNRFVLDLLQVAHGGGLVVEDSDASLVDTARDRLVARYRSLMEAGSGFDRLTEPERHRVRIALKKFRYACDYSRALFPGPAVGPYLRRLSALQDDLGRLNDASVARLIARELAAADPSAAEGASRVGDWYDRWAREAEPGLVESWRTFAATEPFW